MFNQLFMVYATIAMDALGMSLVMPVIPLFVQHLGASGFELGLFYTAYSVTQMISAYFMGSLSDKYGRRLFLLLSLFGSFTGPLFQSFSVAMWMFSLFRAYTGILAGSMTIGQAYIADVIPPEKRAGSFSFILGLGSAAFIFGPAIGGLLGGISLQMPFWVSSGCAFIVFITAIFCLKETNATVIRKTELKAKQRKLLKKTGLSIEESKEVDEIKEELNKLNSKKTKEEKESIKIHWNIYMIFWLVIRFLNECVCVLFSSYFGYYLISYLQGTQMNYSIMLCCTGIVTCIIQGFLYSILRDKLHTSVVYIGLLGCIIMLSGAILCTVANSVWMGILGGILLLGGYAFVSPNCSVVLSIQAPPECQGKALSMSTVTSEAVYIVIPMVFGAIYDVSPFWTICSMTIFSALILLLLLIFWCIPGSLTCADKKESTESKEGSPPSSKIESDNSDASIIMNYSKDTMNEDKNISINMNTESPVMPRETESKNIVSTSHSVTCPSLEVKILVSETNLSISPSNTTTTTTTANIHEQQSSISIV
ncbi:hypothetical protein WA158_000315 [Blastocystis sp. Blastoise]